VTLSEQVAELEESLAAAKAEAESLRLALSEATRQ
jgi:hypothetical protein